MKKKIELYYVAFNKTTNIPIITTSKEGVSEFLGISVDTIRRHLKDVSYYETKKYIIQRDTPIIKCKKGFAIRPASYYKKE